METTYRPQTINQESPLILLVDQKKKEKKESFNPTTSRLRKRVYQILHYSHNCCTDLAFLFSLLGEVCSFNNLSLDLTLALHSGQPIIARSHIL